MTTVYSRITKRRELKKLRKIREDWKRQWEPKRRVKGWRRHHGHRR